MSEFRFTRPSSLPPIVKNLIIINVLVFAAQIKSKAGLQQLPYKEVVLWSLSDSLLDSKPGLMGRTMNKESGLFKIGSTVYTVDEWINFAKMNRYNTSGKIKSYPDLMDEFIKKLSLSILPGTSRRL